MYVIGTLSSTLDCVYAAEPPTRSRGPYLRCALTTIVCSFARSARVPNVCNKRFISWRSSSHHNRFESIRAQRGEGLPDNAFTAHMPKLITPQGQNRAAMCIMALGRDLGLSFDRAGEFGDSALFESESEYLSLLSNSTVVQRSLLDSLRHTLDE